MRNFIAIVVPFNPLTFQTTQNAEHAKGLDFASLRPPNLTNISIPCSLSLSDGGATGHTVNPITVSRLKH